jgi:hypothetical protein
MENILFGSELIKYVPGICEGGRGSITMQAAGYYSRGQL